MGSKKFVKKNFCSERGQSGAVFRLLIDSIIGLLILTIIVSVLGYFEALRVDTSRTEFLSLVKAASEAPDGSVLHSGILVFVKGTGFDSIQLQSLTNYPAECFEFQSNLHSFDIRSEGKFVELKQNIETKVFVKCVPRNDYACDIYCTISFGKTLNEGIE